MGTMIDTEADALLIKVLKGEAERLTEKDESTLTEHREAVIQRLNAIFSKEIPLLLQGEKCLDAGPLYWGLALAGFLKVSEISQWVQKLCTLPMEMLEETLGEYFVTEELAYLLADTMDEWSALKILIENPALDEYVRSACLSALGFCIVNGKAERWKITAYFKSLFQRIFSGKLDDESFCTHLVASCTDIWPGECLEEIRESFGLTLVDETFIDLDHVIKDFLLGEEACLAKIQKQLKQRRFGEALPNLPDFSDPNQSRKLDQLLQLTDQARAEADQTLNEGNQGTQRNEVCFCGSGRKFKKCCMNKPKEIPSKVIIEESVISYGPLEESDALKALPAEVKDSILDLYHLLDENPEEVLAVAPVYISKYPNIPMLYNFLYGACRKTGRPREAMKVMKETVQKFPDYLFGRVEYALYMLRRGEPEKAHAALENAGTLSQLYPQRKIFHAAEWNAFSHAMSRYWIQKDNINQAKIYLKIIQEVAPNSYQCTDLLQRMKRKVFLQSLDRLQKKLESQETPA